MTLTPSNIVPSFSKMPLCIQHGRIRFYHYYPIFPSTASDKEGSLQNRPGTDYFQRNCNPDFTPVDMMDVGSSMTSFVGSGSGSETSVIESSSGSFSRPTSPQGKIQHFNLCSIIKKVLTVYDTH